MEVNKNLGKQFIEIVNNQLKGNDPPETQENFDRLKKEGFKESQIKQMMAQCISVEIFDIMKFGKPYDNERYIKNLKALPKEPFD